MAKNKEGRPEWFKFWRRNRLQLDIEQLSMESRGKVFTNMMRYFDSGCAELLDMSDLEYMAFNVVKINMDDSFADFSEKSSVNQENGKKGGRPSKKTDNNRKKQKTEERGQNTEDRSGANTDKPSRAPRFTPPSVEEVTDYCWERRNHIDPQRFHDYYTANGWTQGKGTPIKDWKAAVRTWEHKEIKADIRSPERYTYTEEESL